MDSSTMTQRVRVRTKELRRLSISPLRYPGGKGSLFSPLRRLIRINGLSDGTYVEPYAGGAGAALALLASGEVRRIVINDLDPAIYAFWRAATRHAKDFATLLAEAVLTVGEWEKQHDAYLNAARDDYLRLGFATFYLNRTNRSGALNGGPIGGKDQTGNYKIDARFNKQTLAERFRIIALYSKRISVSNVDGMRVIRDYATKDRTLIYADPPYFEKAGSLYLNSFTEADHGALAECLNARETARWILTYDNVPAVHQLYEQRRRQLFSLNYSAHRVMKATEVMVFSDAMKINDDDYRLF
jgi:DNA adenine methylase